MFEWSVSKGTYKSLQLAFDGKKVWYTCETHEARWTAKRYIPLTDHPALFLAFADTVVNPESVIAFTDRYGLLGQPVLRTINVNGVTVRAESLPDWRNEHRQLTELVFLWRAARECDTVALSKKIIWNDGAPYHGKAADNAEEPEYFVAVSGQFQEGDIIEPALSLVREHLNQKLYTGSLAAPQIEYTLSGSALIHTPRSLLGAMYLQFAQAIVDNREFKRCSVCKEWFVVNEGAGGRNRQHCSNACRVKAHKSRRQEAQRLAADGVVLEDIAVSLGTDADTVRKWISASSQDKFLRPTS